MLVGPLALIAKLVRVVRDWRDHSAVLRPPAGSRGCRQLLLIEMVDFQEEIVGWAVVSGSITFRFGRSGLPSSRPAPSDRYYDTYDQPQVRDRDVVWRTPMNVTVQARRAGNSALAWSHSIWRSAPSSSG
jgi:hypothetical protein